MSKKDKTPAVAWLWMAGYMHTWLEGEFGGSARTHDKPVLSVSVIPGAKDILRMATEEDMLGPENIGISLSASRMSMLEAGLQLDADTVGRMYGATDKDLQLYVPIECPSKTLTKYGVLRPWTHDVRFGRNQANLLRNLLRAEFWKAVEAYDGCYAEEMVGTPYPAIEMVSAFCQATKTPEMYVDEIRREWQRREKRRTRGCV